MGSIYPSVDEGEGYYEGFSLCCILLCMTLTVYGHFVGWVMSHLRGASRPRGRRQEALAVNEVQRLQVVRPGVVALTENVLANGESYVFHRVLNLSSLPSLTSFTATTCSMPMVCPCYHLIIAC